MLLDLLPLRARITGAGRGRPAEHPIPYAQWKAKWELERKRRRREEELLLLLEEV